MNDATRLLAKARRALTETYGFADFRPGQEEILAAAFAGEDVLAVMPTGAGKSLCYQLPALARGGLTLVVSPLIALMRDQVAQLDALGISAAALNSASEPDERRRVAAARQGFQQHELACGPQRGELRGKGSWFLPFNKGWNDGAGNPPNPGGLKTDYLWKEILSKNGLTDILENYAQIIEKKDEKRNKKKYEQIFPRLCQARRHRPRAGRALLQRESNQYSGNARRRSTPYNHRGSGTHIDTTTG